jgi:hypothetical protein
VAQALNGRGERTAELFGAPDIMLQQMVGHAPGRTDTHARQAAQGFD